MKPEINFQFICVTFHFKPWKGRISNLLFVWDSKLDFLTEVSKTVNKLRSIPKYRRRTIESIELTKTIKI